MNGKIAVFIRIVIKLFEEHKNNLITLTVICGLSCFFWLKNTPEINKTDMVIVEISKAIFLGSIIGYFIEGTSWQSDIKELLIKSLAKSTCCVVLLPSLEEAQINNIYVPRSNRPHDPIDRMKELISETKEILWVKQVSLFTLANENGYLYETFQNKYKNIKNIKLLLIDTDSDHAKMRAYREYRLKEGSHVEYNNFCNSDEFKDGALYRDTYTSMKNLSKLCYNYYGNNGPKKGQSCFYLGKYYSSPEAAIMITDHAVLFEPLHFGNIDAINHNQNKSTDKILSGKMPMFEFRKKEYPGMYELIKNNFEFVLDNFSKEIKCNENA